MAHVERAATLALLLAVGCGSTPTEQIEAPRPTVAAPIAAPVTTPVVAAPVEERVTPAVAAPLEVPTPSVPSPAEALLAARPDGSALLVLDVAERWLIVLGPAEATAAQEGETLETMDGGARLEDEAPMLTPRTLQLI